MSQPEERLASGWLLRLHYTGPLLQTRATRQRSPSWVPPERLLAVGKSYVCIALGDRSAMRAATGLRRA